jgi:hypothetical protein
MRLRGGTLHSARFWRKRWVDMLKLKVNKYIDSGPTYIELECEDLVDSEKIVHEN